MHRIRSNAIKEKGRAQSKALEAITSQFVLRRLQTDVFKSLLPPRIKQLLLFCHPTKHQRELYQGIAKRASKSIGSVGLAILLRWMKMKQQMMPC
mmetsp:Transcript_28674/g.61160  ORF Transcript_28674/g.61160 Transcript_28674/m.61160 type:complete len:95 (+) Transcript_28674:577-861(+)